MTAVQGHTWSKHIHFCQTPNLRPKTRSWLYFTLDNNDNDNDNDNNDNNPHLNLFKGTVLGVKEQGLGIRDKG